MQNDKPERMMPKNLNRCNVSTGFQDLQDFTHKPACCFG
jgi:hypothetical protein